MSAFTDPAEAGKLICGAAYQDDPSHGDLELLPEYGWWPEPGSAHQAEADREAGR